MSSDDTLVTIDEAAELLSTSVRTVARMQADGILEPVYVATPRNPKARRRYRRSDVETLAEQATT